ncbi:MAG: hypothetical protein ACRETM_03990 [Stenotrophobium sp.]
MEGRAFALRLLVILFTVALIGFWAEAALEFSLATDPVTGQPLQFSHLQVTTEMVRAAASPMCRAYNNILALLLTFIALAIPITANLYTPKLIEIFIRDRINLFVLCGCVLLTAHSILVAALAFDRWPGQFRYWIDCLGAVIGWVVLLPYYFYVLGFLNPVTIIKRVHRSLMEELEDATRGKYPVAVAQQRVNQRIINLGSVLLRAVDRADRDVTFDAIRTHMLELVRVRNVKLRLPADFFKVNNSLMIGMSSDGTDIVSESGIWMEYRIVNHLILAYRTAAAKMSDGASALAHAVKNAAHDEACRHNDAVYYLLVRTLNSFMREAIKKKENAPVFNAVYNYKTLARRLLSDRPELVPELARHLFYYANFARSQGLGFIYELISYELAELVELAFQREAAPSQILLDTLLQLHGSDQHLGLIKSRAILGAYFLEHGRTADLARLEASLARVSTTMLVRARDEIVNTRERLFWEVTDRATNFDYVADARREWVNKLFDQLEHTATQSVIP